MIDLIKERMDSVPGSREAPRRIAKYLRLAIPNPEPRAIETNPFRSSFGKQLFLPAGKLVERNLFRGRSAVERKYDVRSIHHTEASVPSAILQTLMRPFPIANLGLIDAIGEGVVEALANLVLQPILDVSAGDLQPGHAIDRVDGEVETVGLILNCQLERSADASDFLVAAHVQVDVIGPAVGQLVNQRRVAVKIKNDWLVDREQAVKVAVGKTMRMFAAR